MARASIFYIQEGGVGTFVTEGLWTPQDTFEIPAGHALTLAVAPTCKDVRRKRYVLAICLYQVFSKQRVAALKGVCPGRATKARATLLCASKRRSMLASSITQSGRPGNPPRPMRPSRTFTNWTKDWISKTLIKFGRFCSARRRLRQPHPESLSG